MFILVVTTAKRETAYESHWHADRQEVLCRVLRVQFNEFESVLVRIQTEITQTSHQHFDNNLKQNICSDLQHLVGPCFAEYWTICTLRDATRPSAVIGNFVPQDSLLLQIPAGTAADRTGRPSSDVTVGYIVR
ncbi:hypothetical protein XENOCAPTIV_026787 [Xenoophorus captivus]|uniref:Uncharacterized protein n=1 Tax=Xenoophorus captivus TaxID=1517983 RepID=A0ABV0RJ21_9TELE